MLRELVGGDCCWLCLVVLTCFVLSSNSREYDAKRNRTPVSLRPSVPRGSFYSAGRHRTSDSDLNTTRHQRATHAWDLNAQARAQDRTRQERTHAPPDSPRGQAFGWGTGGLYQGRGWCPDDRLTWSRFEQLTERERKMDVRLQARVRNAKAQAARRDEMLVRSGGFVSCKYHSGVWASLSSSDNGSAGNKRH